MTLAELTEALAPFGALPEAAQAERERINAQRREAHSAQLRQAAHDAIDAFEGAEGDPDIEPATRATIAEAARAVLGGGAR